MDRAYSLLEIRAVDGETREITGVATTPTTDRVGDIVEPLGVQFKNPMPLLWQHRHDAPVGTVTFDKPTTAGITFRARLPKIDEEGTLKARVDEAWQSVKAGLVRAVSIGFRPLEYSRMDAGGLRFIESEVLELSLVTVPANADATITAIKSIDAELRAASGQEQTDAEKQGDENGGADTSVAAAPEPAPSKGHVVKLTPVRARTPFVINRVRV